MSHEDISFKTEDNIEIKADYFNSDSNKSLILLHQLTMTKHQWKKFAEKAQAKGYNVLAIDLRGHGISEGNIDEFTDKDFNNMILDVKAAHNYLKEKNPNTKVAIIGSSLGSNLAIKYLVNSDISTAIAISPGENYRGLSIKEDIKKAGKNLLIITCKGDAYSYESSTRLTKDTEIKLEICETADHGNKLLDEEYESMMFKWIEDHMQ